MRWKLHTLFATVAVATCAASAAAQPSIVAVHDDHVVMQGCVRPVDALGWQPNSMLVLSHGNLMLAGVTGLTGGEYPIGTTGMMGHVFYWLREDDAHDLAEHVGQMVEVRGELKDFERGEVDIDFDHDYTKIELKLDGKKEEARVPTAWLFQTDMRDHDFEIITRRIDLKDVDVLGACNSR